MSIDSEEQPKTSSMKANQSTKANVTRSVIGGLAGDPSWSVSSDSHSISEVETGQDSPSTPLETTKEALPVITQNTLVEHNHPESLWIVHNGLVYDVTQFAKDHPGGFDSLYQHAGQDVAELMQDEMEHAHSESAYDILQDCLIGVLDSVAASGRSDQHVLQSRMDKNFLKFDEPTVWQLLTSNYSKDYYLEQVHIPRHLNYDARFFKYDWMEMLTMTPWYVVPIVWLPVVIWSAFKGWENGLSAEGLVASFVSGLLTWTLIEYIFHRYIFHMECLLPNHPIALTIHYLVHGVHHVIPMDRYRLAMPPVLFFCLQTGPRALALQCLPTSIAHALYAGTVTGYILYDLTHYFCHHATFGDGYLKRVKTYHMAHHYKDANLGFGVSSKLWDLVFNTKLTVR